MNTARSFGRWFITAAAVVALTGPFVEADHTAVPASVALAGSFQDELGCPADWQPDCAVTEMTYDATDQMWRATFTIPAGSWEYKAALNDSWTEAYGANAVQGGANIPLVLPAETAVTFYYSHTSHWITDNQNFIICNLPGSFQTELGCPGDWTPWCLLTWLQDIDDDGTYSFTTDAIPTGDWEVKVAHDESWDVNYGAGGVFNGPNIPFTVINANQDVTFDYDSVTHILTISGPGVPVELMFLTVE